MASCSQPSQGPMSYHRPRPSLSHAASTPPVVSGRAEDRVQAVETVNCKPLPSRPANHLQQQHCAHSKSFDSRFNPTTSSLTDCLNTTEVLPLPDEEVLASRPPLTSKFSFDNLAAMSDGSESGGAFKKMVTRQWLQNLAQAARNSTISSSSTACSTIQSMPNTSTVHVSEQAHSQANTSVLASRQPSSFHRRFRRAERERETRRSPSPTKQSLSFGTMVISNPELVHPALGGSALPNTKLGSGARRIGLPAEAFGANEMSKHRMYVPPASPPPRKSEDSVRSLDSTTSTAISYGSGCTTSTTLSGSSDGNKTPSHTSSFACSRAATRQDRDLPYLPLRLKPVLGESTSKCTESTSPTDAVEQLILTPQLPPETTQYAHKKSLYQDTERSDQRRPAGTFKFVPTSRMYPQMDSIPFGHSALSRPTSLSKDVTNVKTDGGPPLSPPFAMISPLNSSRKVSGDALQCSTNSTRMAPSASAGNALPSKDRYTEQRESSFQAMLLQPVPVFPANLLDDEKLVNVHVGGSKVYTTRLSAITSHPDSHVAQFLKARLSTSETVKHAGTKGETEIALETPIADAPEELRLTKRAGPDEPHMSETFTVPATVTLNLPASPIHALRSARASIFGDVPWDEEEEGGQERDENTDAHIFGGYADVKSFRDKLEVPLPTFPNPRNNRLRFSRRNTDESKTAGERTASSSEYASTEAGEDFLMNFLDTTPDDESEDPFILQSSPLSSLLSSESTSNKVIYDQRHQQESKIDKKRKETAELRKESLESRYSNSSSHPPSLSSSPNSSAYDPRGDSPILLSGAAKQLMGCVTTGGAFETLIAQHEQNMLHPINVYLDRSADSYGAIFHYLRSGSLPRKLRLEDSIYHLAHSGQAKDSSDSIHAVLESLPLEARAKLMPLVLHPMMSEIRDLKEEAQYLGFKSLVDLCDVEISKLKKMIRWSRNLATHPGMHLRSESDASAASAGGTQSPSRLLGKHVNRPRPRLVGHRQFNSESKVIPRPVQKRSMQDNWI